MSAGAYRGTPQRPSKPAQSAGNADGRTAGGESSPLHYNHRYQFNPLLNEALTQTGIRVSALGGEGTVVDAIGASAGQFWCGIQGHPELGSRQDALHPLVTALLRRAAGEE